MRPSACIEPERSITKVIAALRPRGAAFASDREYPGTSRGAAARFARHARHVLRTLRCPSPTVVWPPVFDDFRHLEDVISIDRLFIKI